MSRHHLAGHLDKHTLSHRYVCKEKAGKKIFNKNYQQKSSMVCHLLEKHCKSSLKSADVFVKGERDIDYEPPGKYKNRSKENKAEMINQLILNYGEEVYE